MTSYRTEDAILADIKLSKENGNIIECKEICAEHLLPEAYELMQLAEKDITHKDGYATIMQFLSGVPVPHRATMLRALERIGYPHDTLSNVKEVLAI